MSHLIPSMLHATFRIFSFNKTPLIFPYPQCGAFYEICTLSQFQSTFFNLHFFFHPLSKNVSILLLNNFGSKQLFLFNFTPFSSRTIARCPLILTYTQMKFFDVLFTMKTLFNSFKQPRVK